MSNPNFLKADVATKILFPLTLADYVTAEDPVIAIKEFCQSLPIEIFNYREDGAGKPQYDPRDVMAWIIYCYGMGVFTSRRMEHFAHNMMQGIYIFGVNKIDHATLCRCIVRNIEVFALVLVHVVECAEEEEFLVLDHALLDSSKIVASASAGPKASVRYKNRYEAHEKYEKEHQRVLDVAVKLMSDTAYNKEEDTEVAKKFKKLYAEAKKWKRRMQQLKDAVSNHEAEARENARQEFFRKAEEKYLNLMDHKLSILNERGVKIDELEAEVKAEENYLNSSECTQQLDLRSYKKRREELRVRRYELRNMRRSYKRSMETFCKQSEGNTRPVTEDDLTAEELQELRTAMDAATVRGDKVMNLTDVDCRRRQMPDRLSFKNCHTLQIASDKTGNFHFCTSVTQQANDSHELRPMVEKIKAVFDRVKKFDVDCGYWAEHEIRQLKFAGFDVVVANKSKEKKQANEMQEGKQMNETIENPEHAQRRIDRKLIEKVYGHLKSNLSRFKTHHRGLKKVQGVYQLASVSIDLHKIIALRKKREQEEFEKKYNVKEQRDKVLIREGKSCMQLLQNMASEVGQETDLFAQAQA